MNKKKLTKDEREAVSRLGRELGRIGGQTTAKRLGKKGMSRIGKIGAQKRWKKQAPSAE